MLTITIGSESYQVPSLEEVPPDVASLLAACYARGERPSFLECAPTVAVPAALVPLVAAPAITKPVSTFGAGNQVADESARARIEAQQSALRAAGVDVDATQQLYATGTRLAQVGYDTQASRKAEHERKMTLIDAANELDRRVREEARHDVQVSAATLADGLTCDTKIRFEGLSLSETAIRGLAARLESPMLGYVLGLRDRIVDQLPSSVTRQADLAMICDVLRHECRHNPDATLKLRTRVGSVRDVYAVVSPGYVEADATSVLPDIIGALPEDARATYAYDRSSTQWEIRASVWTPTPVEEQAVGEAFEGYVSLRSRDNGTSKFRGDGGISLLRCLNASTYNAGSQSVSRVHRGDVARDVGAMIRAASSSISALCLAWGRARETEIPLTAREREAGDEFLSAMWLDMLKAKPLAGVLRGSSRDHADELVKAYHAERRDPDRLVRADLAQAWTRMIQTQPPAIRRDAEGAIGAWVVGR